MSGPWGTGGEKKKGGRLNPDAQEFTWGGGGVILAKEGYGDAAAKDESHFIGEDGYTFEEFESAAPPEYDPLHHYFTGEDIYDVGEEATETVAKMDEKAWMEYANSVKVSGFMEEGEYVVTPFDALCIVFSEMDVAEGELEKALEECQYDLEAAAMRLAKEQMDRKKQKGDREEEKKEGETKNVSERGHVSLAGQVSESATEEYDSPEVFEPPMVYLKTSGNQPLVISRDELDSYFSPDATQGPPKRLCRHFLEGSCLRSDCAFSHDIKGAVCKFWLRGGCLKPSCGFLHELPSVVVSDLQQRAASTVSQTAQPPPQPLSAEALGFPVLTAKQKKRSKHSNATTFSQAAKAPKPEPVRMTVLAGPEKGPVAYESTKEKEETKGPEKGLLSSKHNARGSARIQLRTPQLLPSLSTGHDINKLYLQYRKVFFSLGANRNKLLAKASAAYKAGNPGQAKSLSREATEWSQKLNTEGLTAAKAIVHARQKALRDAVMDSATSVAFSAIRDMALDRRSRGRYLGLYGVCLGVVATHALPPPQRHLSSDERTEVALDLHGLHGTEGVQILDQFLSELNRIYFRGLAYVIVGQARHSASHSPASAFKGLGQHCMRFLDDQGFPWDFIGGILIVDPLGV